MRGANFANAKDSEKKLYVLKITNVNRINPYLKDLLLNNQQFINVHSCYSWD